MAYITKNGNPVDFGHQHIETEDIVNLKVPLRAKGGENMNKIYQAIILDTTLGLVTDESWVTAKSKQQAFAKVDTSSHDLDKIKVFLNKIGEYNPQE